MSDEPEWREKVRALELRAEELRETTRRLEGELSVQQERCARAAKAAEELSARIADQTQRRETLRTTLKRIHDLTYAKLLRGGGVDVIEASLDRIDDKARRGDPL